LLLEPGASYITAVPPVGYVLIAAVLAYLLGSVPTGFLVGKARGIDIRKLGSGNIGATNVSRHFGKPAGIFVLFMDVLKGWLAVATLAPALGNHFKVSTTGHEWLAICSGAAAILGHNYTCWLRFRGGKGIATSAGVLLGLVPLTLGIGLAVWIVVFAISRYVSLASICGAAAMPVAAWLTHESPAKVLVIFGLAVMAIARHGSNIRRLLTGTEHRFGTRSTPDFDDQREQHP
jgi:glycerol-3-phosphate acyltransferase PlsY